MVEIPNSCTVILFLILGTSGAWKEESYLTYLRWVKSILYEDEDDFTAETCNDNVKAEIVLAVPDAHGPASLCYSGPTKVHSRRQ